MGVGHILTAYKKERKEVKARYQAAQIEWAGFSLLDEPTSASNALMPLLNKWIRWLNTRRNNSRNSVTRASEGCDRNAILVHCEAGISRSAPKIASMVVGWMIHSELYYPLSPASTSSYLVGGDITSWVNTIIGRVQSCRRWAKPNSGFHLQLIEYARHNVRRVLGFAFRRSLPSIFRATKVAPTYDVLINYLVGSYLLLSQKL